MQNVRILDEMDAMSPRCPYGNENCTRPYRPVGYGHHTDCILAVNERPIRPHELLAIGKLMSDRQREVADHHTDAGFGVRHARMLLNGDLQITFESVNDSSLRPTYRITHNGAIYAA